MSDDRLELHDAALAKAGELLVVASHALSRRGTRAEVGQLQSLTGVASSLALHLRELARARAALAAAARSGSEAIAALMRDSSEFEARITASLGAARSTGERRDS